MGRSMKKDFEINRSLYIVKLFMNRYKLKKCKIKYNMEFLA